MIEILPTSLTEHKKPVKVAVSSVEKSLERIQKIKEKEKIDTILSYAQDISKKWYQYGYNETGKDPVTKKPIFVCDTLIKHLFRKVWETSLDDIHGTKEMYDYFLPDKKNCIRSQNDSLFLIDGKQLSPWDLLFYVEKDGSCWHVALFSKIDEKGTIWIYDATQRSGVAERSLWFDEARTRNIYYTSPVFINKGKQSVEKHKIV